jgi:hypothetical protein
LSDPQPETRNPKPLTPLNPQPANDTDQVVILIDTCLTYVRTHFYQDKPSHDWHRDERQLTKAIARYGYECHQRGWEFEPMEIQRDIIRLLFKMSEQQEGIKYLPVYLEAAIDKHIRTRAEELSALAKAKKSVPALVAKRVNGVQVAVIEHKPAVQILNDVYEGLKAKQKAARQARKAQATEQKQQPKELTLL